MSTLEKQLLDRREALLGFIRSKINDDELAEDILQESLLRAMQSAGDLQDEEKLIPWFYRILRNAITDTYRRHAAAARRLERYALEQPSEDIPEEDYERLCECFRSVLPTMKPEYAQLIESMDLSNEEPEQVAERLEITRNNLKVRHHRARQQLRERLVDTCRTCAAHGCIDCTCSSSTAQPHAR